MAFIDRVYVRVRVQVCIFYSDYGTWGYVKYINLQSHRWSFRLKACDITSMGAVFELPLVCMFGTMVKILLFGRIDTCLDILRQVFPINCPAKYHFIPSTPSNTYFIDILWALSNQQTSKNGMCFTVSLLIYQHWISCQISKTKSQVTTVYSNQVIK